MKIQSSVARGLSAAGAAKVYAAARSPLTIAMALALALSTSLPAYSQQVASKADSKDTTVTVKTQYTTIDNAKIAYRKIGKGTPLILTNRFRGTLDTWDPLFLDLLAKENTVITFDYSGVGYSEGVLPLDIKEVAAEVTKLADSLKIDKFNVAGWSYGGWVAQYVTFLNPSRVLKSVIIGSNPPGKNDVPFEPVFLERALKPSNDFEDFVVLFFEPKSENSRAAAKASITRIMQRYDETKVPAKMELLQRYFGSNEAIAADKGHFRGAFQTLKTPVLVISGDHDISFALENWYPLVKKSPTTQIVVLPDTGHAPHFQYPKLVTGYINTFLKN